MTQGEIAITRFMRSRWSNMLLMALAFATTFFADVTKPMSLTLVDRGTLFKSPSLWFADGAPSRWLAIALNIAVVLMMVNINRRFNLLRSMNLLFVAMFMVMEAATPSALMCFSGGQLCAVAAMWCVTIMFSAYNHPGRTKRVFLAFCVMAAATMVQYGFVVYLPVLLLACGQMRIFSPRMLVAAILGVVTPFWIVFGFGIAAPSQLHMPTIVNPFAELDLTISLQLFATVGLTLLAAAVTGFFNLLKILSMNARMRAMNGMLATFGITTGIIAILDFTNVEFYIPLLNACTAFQIGMFFRFNFQQRAYIPVVFLLLCYWALWVWKLLL